MTGCIISSPLKVECRCNTRLDVRIPKRNLVITQQRSNFEMLKSGDLSASELMKIFQLQGRDRSDPH
jgi:hypothetical protein